MKSALREALGKAAMSASNPEESLGEWEELPPFMREHFMGIGEAVAKELVSHILPVVVGAILTDEELRDSLVGLAESQKKQDWRSSIHCGLCRHLECPICLQCHNDQCVKYIANCNPK